MKWVTLAVVVVISAGSYVAWRHLSAPISVDALIDEPPALSPPTKEAGRAAADAGSRSRPPGAGDVSRPRPSVATVVPPARAVEAMRKEASQRINGFSPTSKHINRFASEVCSAFARGYSYEQVKAGVMKAAGRYPFLGVSSTDADFGVRESVRVYCPAYQDRLSDSVG
jgi:hypothetical protein